jgi:carbamoyl-phosphate synthase large subunit
MNRQIVSRQPSVGSHSKQPLSCFSIIWRLKIIILSPLIMWGSIGTSDAAITNANSEPIMSKYSPVPKALVIGPGPVRIGEGTELDDLCVRACRTLKGMGFTVVVISPNPAALCTESEIADIAYAEPHTVSALFKIIEKEHPDQLFFEFSGSEGQRLVLEAGTRLREFGLLTDETLSAIGTLGDRNTFLDWASSLGYKVSRHATVATVESAAASAGDLGFPIGLSIPDSRTQGISKIVYNIEELNEVVDHGLSSGSIQKMTMESILSGWQGADCVILRDRFGKTAVAGLSERLDPVEVHTLDSVGVMPPVALDDAVCKTAVLCASRLVEALGIVGAVEVELAIDGSSSKVIPFKARLGLSGISSFMSRAGGKDIPGAAAAISCGKSLKETEFSSTPSDFEAKESISGIAVRFPRWDFERLEGAMDRLGPQPASVGMAMAMGSDFIEAFQKAVCSLDCGRFGLGLDPVFSRLSLSTLLEKLSIPCSTRYFMIYEALLKGANPLDISRLTGVPAPFIHKIAAAAVFERELETKSGSILDKNTLLEAKKKGFSDSYLSCRMEKPEAEIRRYRLENGIEPHFKPILKDAMAADWFSTYHDTDLNQKPPMAAGKEKVLLVGGGPNRIGQGGEVDFALARAVSAVDRAGKLPVVIDCNPFLPVGGASTSRSYIEPLTVEAFLAVHRRERPTGVIVQFGGNTAISLDTVLSEADVTVLGTPLEGRSQSHDRVRFRQTVKNLAIPQPLSDTAESTDEALSLAERIGYPVLVRTAGFPGIRATEEISDAAMLNRFISECPPFSRERPLQIDSFLDNAVEITVDAVSDGEELYIPAIMEHIELAGIHSGDAACMTPPISIAPKHVEIITAYTREIAAAIKAKGLFNIEYALINNTVYVLQVRPGASRTVPFISKIIGVDLVDMAMAVIFGKRLGEIPKPALGPSLFAVKETVFPFDRFPEMVPSLGLKMHSTGAVLGLGDSFGMAFFKSQEAGRMPLPLKGGALFSIADRDKTAALEPVRLFRQLGFDIIATPGTCEFLTKRGIPCRQIKKIGYGRPNLLDVVKNGEIQLIVNTVADKKSTMDSAYMRKTAISGQVPYITTTASAIAAAKGIAARRAGEPEVIPLPRHPKA